MAGPKKVALIAGLYVLFVDLCVCQVWLLSLVVISLCAFLRLLFDIVLVREVGVGGMWFKVGAQVEAVKDRSWCYVLALHAQAGLRIFVQRFEF